MQHDPESSSDRRESSSGNAGTSEGSNGSSSRFAARGPRAAQGVPQYVDMVIPDYESSSRVDREQQAKQGKAPSNSMEASSESRRHAGARREEENGSRSESQMSYRSSEDSVCCPTGNDVILNEAADHPGNLRYRAVVRHLAKKYTKVKIGYRRAAVQILVNAVKAQGGRFLKCSRDGDWKEVSDKKAYAKSSQAIRGTCRKVEIVSSRSRKRKSRRQRPRPSHSHPQEQRLQSSSETGSESGEDRKSNLEMIALRLQTKDKTLTHLHLDLQAVNHDFLFPFAKALDTSDILSSLEIHLSHMNRTNANALAWGIKRCRGLKQVKLSYGKLSEKSSIVLAGILDNPSIESLNVDGNDMGTEPLKAICRMISQAKGSRLQRLSLEDNPFGDDGAIVLAKLISSSKTLRYVNLAGNSLQANGIAVLKAALKKKTNCLFEISGLEASGSRKRAAVPEISEDSEPAAKKQRNASSAPPQASRLQEFAPKFCPSEQASSEQARSTSSSNGETGAAPSGSNGTDEGPTSSMIDSHGSPSSAST